MGTQKSTTMGITFIGTHLISGASCCRRLWRRLPFAQDFPLKDVAGAAVSFIPGWTEAPEEQSAEIPESETGLSDAEQPSGTRRREELLLNMGLASSTHGTRVVLELDKRTYRESTPDLGFSPSQRRKAGGKAFITCGSFPHTDRLDYVAR